MTPASRPWQTINQVQHSPACCPHCGLAVSFTIGGKAITRQLCAHYRHLENEKWDVLGPWPPVNLSPATVHGPRQGSVLAEADAEGKLQLILLVAISCSGKSLFYVTRFRVIAPRTGDRIGTQGLEWLE